MPRLRITNITAETDSGIVDTSGQSSFRLTIPADSTVSASVTQDVLERLASQLDGLEDAGIITYYVDADPAVDARIQSPTPGLQMREVKRTFTAAQLASLTGSSEAVALTGFPANACPVWAAVEINDLVSGIGVTSVTATVGDAGDADEIMATVEAYNAAADSWLSIPGVSAGEYVFESAYAPIVTLVSNVAFTNVTVGELVVHLYYMAPQSDSA